MGWFDAAIGIANLGANVYQANKLEQMRRQGAEAAAIQKVLQHLKNLIFRFHSAAEEILKHSDENPVGAALAMRLLHQDLMATGITPEIFPDISDKDFAHKTIKLIEESDRKLYGAITSEEREQVNLAVDAAGKIPDYDYYLDNYDKIQDYRAALPVYNELKGANSVGLTLGFIVALFLVPLFGCSVAGLFGALIGSPSAFATLSLLGALGGAAVVGFLWHRNNQKKRADEFNEAKRIVEDVEENVDLGRYNRLERKLGKDKAAVQALRDEADTLVRTVIGDETAWALPS